MGFLSFLSNIIFNSYIFSGLGEFLIGSLFGFVMVWYITKICKTANNSAASPEEQEVDEGKTTQSITASECPVMTIEGKEEPLLLTGTPEVKSIAGNDAPLLISGVIVKEEVAKVDIKALIGNKLPPANLKMIKTVLEIQSSFKKIKHVEFHGDFILYNYIIDKLIKEINEPKVLFEKVNNFLINFSKLKIEEVHILKDIRTLSMSFFLDIASPRIKLLESVNPRIPESNEINNHYLAKLSEIYYPVKLLNIFKEQWYPKLFAHFDEWERKYSWMASKDLDVAILYERLKKLNEQNRWSIRDKKASEAFSDAKSSENDASVAINQFTVDINGVLEFFEKDRLALTEAIDFLLDKSEAKPPISSSIPDMPILIITKDNIDKIDPRIKDIIGIPKDLEEFPCMLQDSDSMGLLGSEVVDALLEIIQNI